MRIHLALLALLLAAPAALWTQNPVLPSAHADRCANDPKSAACKDEKQARNVFSRALKLKKAGRDDEAFDALEQAARLAPENMEYVTAREVVRQQMVFANIQRGNKLMSADRRVEASAAFRRALDLDSTNQFARERLHDALAAQFPNSSRMRVEQSAEIQLVPEPGVRDFHYRGDARGLLQTITRAFGITAMFDESFIPRPARFDLEGADFATAMRVACRMTKSFWSPLAMTQVVIAADNPQNHQQFDRMALRTFYLPDANSPQELNDIMNVLRVLFDIRRVTQQPASATITARAPQEVLDAATRFLEDFHSAKPQVMLDMAVYEVNRDALLNLGLSIPTQFQVFNISAAALAALTSPNIQNLINQLIASGGINQANTEAIAALLSQLQSQQNSLFSQPVATFGGGKTLTGIAFPPMSANFSWHDSRVSSLEHVTLRASHGNPATLRLGTRYPILNATFAPIFNTPQISQVLANQSFIAPFPSFSYEDLGVTLKATPSIQGKMVTMQLELEIKALGAQNFNGVPVIANRAYKTAISVNDGEPAVVAGMVSQAEQSSVKGPVGLAQLPVFSYVFANPTRQQTTGEILVVITPHIVRGNPTSGTEVWMSGS